MRGLPEGSLKDGWTRKTRLLLAQSHPRVNTPQGTVWVASMGGVSSAAVTFRSCTGKRWSLLFPLLPGIFEALCVFQNLMGLTDVGQRLRSRTGEVPGRVLS